MNVAIDIIITFLKNWHSYNENGTNYEYLGAPTDKYNTECINLWAPRYLLGQILRQIPVTKKYVSDAAQKLWNQLTDEDIWKYNYQDKVQTKNEDVTVKKYKGASKTPEDKEGKAVGNSFIFREVFHDEHIIPIAVIIEELLYLKDSEIEITPEKVAKIIDKICICRITKEEDRKIKPRYKRSSDLSEAYETAYKPKNVKITSLEEELKN
jgi:hypothetical protein